LQLGKEDHTLIAEAQEKLKDIPGDLSHHLGESNELLAVERAVTQGKRIEYCSGSKWELIAVSETVLLSVEIYPLTFQLTKHYRVIAVRYALATQSEFQAPQQTRPFSPSQLSAALHHGAKPWLP
jgi:hypothetical protein